MQFNRRLGKETEAFTGQSIVQFIIKFRTVFILIVLMLVFFGLNSLFLHPTNLLNMVKRMSYVLIPGFGMTFIITKGALDLSVGSIAAVVGVSFAMLIKGGAMPVVLAIFITIAIALALGSLNGFVSVKGRIEPFLVTLATMNIYRGLALTLAGGKPIFIAAPGFTDMFGNGRVLGIIPTPVIILIIFFIITWFLFYKTKYGFYVRCIGGNPEAARVAGINIDRIRIITFMISALYACFAGFILAALMNGGLPDIGSDLALDAISGVILGGTAIVGGFGSVWGTVGGCLIMATMNSGMSLLGAQYPQQILVKGIVIILAVLMDNTLKSGLRR